MQVGAAFDATLIRTQNSQQSTKPQENSAQKKQDNTNENELSASEKAQVSKLQARDTAVRRHEAAHIAAGGGIVKSAANFTYQKGPDNQLYAIGGEVAIDTGKEATPEETIAKMQTVRAAALAPADPSSTDYQVASTATMMEMRARMELAQEKMQEITKDQDPYSQESDENENDTSKPSEAFSSYA